MAGIIFKTIFKKDPGDFNCISEINNFVEHALRRKLEIKRADTNLCSSRGSIFPFRQVDSNKEIDKALKRMAS